MLEAGFSSSSASTPHCLRSFIVMSNVDVLHLWVVVANNVARDLYLMKDSFVLGWGTDVQWTFVFLGDEGLSSVWWAWEIPGMLSEACCSSASSRRERRVWSSKKKTKCAESAVSRMQRTCVLTSKLPQNSPRSFLHAEVQVYLLWSDVNLEPHSHIHTDRPCRPAQVKPKLVLLPKGFCKNTEAPQKRTLSSGYNKIK